MDSAARISNFLRRRDDISELVLDAVDYAICNGIMMRRKSQPKSSQVVKHVPFTLFPCPVPRKLYEQAKAVQKDFQNLLHFASQDPEFMKSTFASVIERDEFIRKLYEIYEISQQKKPKKTSMSFVRADYMFHKPDENPPSLKQIEINMISGSGAIGTGKMTSLHEHTLRQADFGDIATQLPRNDSLPNFAQSILNAWGIYGNYSAIIMFVVPQLEHYVFDHRTLIYKILEKQHDVVVKCYSLTQVAELARVDADGRLFINDEEIGVVYFRAGYSPDHYPTKQEWDARLLIECSNAINCPCVGHQLVGTKKVQQVLSQSSVLKRFIKDQNSFKRIMDTFVGFHGLDMGTTGDEAVAKILRDPTGYVLKPQLEGGGNNLYGDDLVAKLEEVGRDSRRCMFIAMEKVQPMTVDSLIVDSENGYDNPTPIRAVTELGIFGYFIVKNGEIMYNSIAGHLLRTKASHVDEGGIIQGGTALDSPLLY